jgi:hypothetical protein
MKLKSTLAAVLAFASLGLAGMAFACESPATYRSVVVNVAPSQVSEGATIFKVRIESALYSAALQDLQGLRGEIVAPQSISMTESKFEIASRLGSMCNTWIELWSSDHNTTDGVLTGFIVGYPKGVRDGYLLIEPLLYQAAAYRDPDPTRSRGRVAKGAVKRIDPEATWRPFRIDAAALARNLDDTNAQIKADLERLDKQ